MNYPTLQTGKDKLEPTTTGGETQSNHNHNQNDHETTVITQLRRNIQSASGIK